MITLANTNKSSMEHGVQNLLKEHVKDGSLVVIFFSGHGAEFKGDFYLLPLEMRSNEEQDYEYEALSVDWIVRKLSGSTSVVNVLQFDCRANEENSTFKATKRTRSGAKGNVQRQDLDQTLDQQLEMPNI